MRAHPLVRLLATTAVAASLLAVGAPSGATAASSRLSGTRPHLPPRPHATGAPAPATNPASSIDVVVPLHLSSAARRGLVELAQSGLSRTERRARLTALAPRHAQALAVQRWAASHGFRVTTTTPWAVTLHGRAGALAGAFSTSLTTTRHLGTGFVTPRTTPRVPTELRGIVDTVVGLDTRPLFHARAVYGGGDLQVLNSTPVRGRNAGAGTTVGTVNLSGWHPEDLTTYRRAAFGPSDTPPTVTPVFPGARQSQAATVLEDDYGMETEVALDAEAIAGVAPAAAQRMYFADNSSAGYLQILQQMATDAQGGLLQTASTSWGACELLLPQTDIDAMRSAITAITAAGATFFAASGDLGAYGCGDGMTPAVDFPAAAENAVAVGGTTVTGSAPSYTSTAWDGSGGGCSQTVPAPVWQQGTTSPCKGRSVPDIATLADPQSGFWVYDRVNQWIPVGGTSLAAPASAAGLAVALSHGNLTGITGAGGSFLMRAYANASKFADVFTGDNGLYRATAGYDLATGLGSPLWTEVEAFLKGTPALAPTGYNEPLVAVNPTDDPWSASLDIRVSFSTSLTGFVPNGEPVDSYTVGAADCSGGQASPAGTSAALPGQQGLQWFWVSVHRTSGAPACIGVQRPVVADSIAPVAPVPVATYKGTARPSYRFSWGAATDSGSGVQLYVLTVKDLTTGTTVLDGWWTTGRGFPYAGDPYLSVTPGHRYGVEVDVYDGAWNAAYKTAAFHPPYDDRSASLSSGWTRKSSSAAYMGSFVYSAKAGAYAKFRFTGKYLNLGVIQSRYGGYADVYVDNVKKGRISLYASSTVYRKQVRVATFTTAGTHTVVVKVVGAHPSGSLGNNVYLDSFTVD